MSFNAIRENKILAKISEFAVVIGVYGFLQVLYVYSQEEACGHNFLG